MSMVNRFVRLAVALGAIPIAMPAQAADSDEVLLEEIVVTAQKREESLRDVPLSVEAVAGDKLADAGIVRLDDLKAYVPNLQMTETGIANNIYIRGIGSGLNQGFEQSVSMYMDGIYRGRGHQSRMPFLDLARVEVLRGPQPILFGKNAVAGAINMVAALPTPDFQAEARGSYDVENHETMANVVLSGPLTSTLGGRVALYHRNADGYIENATLGRKEPRRNEVAGRIMLTGEFSDALDVSLRVEGGKFDSDGRQIEIFGETPIPVGSVAGLRYSQVVGGPVPALPQGQNATARNNVIDYVRSSSGDRSNTDSFETALTVNYKLAGDVTLTSITGLSRYKLDELCDCDFTGATIFTAGIQEDYKQYSQEIRLTSGTGGNFSWIGGLFFQRYELDESDYLYVPPTSLVPAVLPPTLGQQFYGAFLQGRPIPCNSVATCNALGVTAAGLLRNAANPRVFQQDSSLASAFLQGTWELNEKWSTTVGGRFSHESKKGSRVTTLTNGLGGPAITSPLAPLVFDPVLGIVPHSETGKRSEDNFSPMINVQYRVSDDAMAYVSAARGYKSGGFDARSNKPVSQGGSFEFEDERATTYEFGVKSGIGGRAEISAAAFFTDYKDLQTSAFDGAIGFNVGNGSAEIRGIEVEGRWRPVRSFLLSGSVAVLDFDWTKYQGQCFYDRLLAAPNVANCNYAGRTNQLAPNFTGYVSAEYSWPVGDRFTLKTTADLVHSSSYLQSLNLDPVATQEAYSKLNARIALGGADGHWELAVVGRNLTDKTTVSYAGDTPLAFRLFRARSYYGFVDPPRSVAIEAKLKF